MHYAKRVSSEGMIKDNNKILSLAMSMPNCLPLYTFEISTQATKKKKENSRDNGSPSIAADHRFESNILELVHTELRESIDGH